MGLFGNKNQAQQHDGYHDIEEAGVPIIADAVVVPSAPPAEQMQPVIAVLPTATVPSSACTQSAIIGGPTFRRFPIMIGSCPHCGIRNTRTKTRTYPNFATWALAGVLLILFWPLCWLPLVMDKTKKTDHFCTSCGTLVGEVRPMEDCCEKRRG
mmetsp:Transcript_14239/g.20838  ORF Transcript_14239/g.20838 Transcript_14239/m.20838 type:complete len:154 (-) Transcript_14239:244-705(-)